MQSLLNILSMSNFSFLFHLLSKQQLLSKEVPAKAFFFVQINIKHVHISCLATMKARTMINEKKTDASYVYPDLASSLESPRLNVYNPV
jgi:hypothetical protein